MKRLPLVRKFLLTASLLPGLVLYAQAEPSNPFTNMSDWEGAQVFIGFLLWLLLLFVVAGGLIPLLLGWLTLLVLKQTHPASPFQLKRLLKRACLAGWIVYFCTWVVCLFNHVPLSTEIHYSLGMAGTIAGTVVDYFKQTQRSESASDRE